MGVDAKADATGCLVQDLPRRADTSALLLTPSAVRRLPGDQSCCRYGEQTCPRLCGETVLRLSARNQLAGTVAAIEVGAVMTVVKVDVLGGQQVTSSVTKEAVDELGLHVGSPVTVVIKSTEVMLAVD